MNIKEYEMQKKISSILWFLFYNGLFLATLVLVVRKMEDQPTLLSDSPEYILVLAAIGCIVARVDFSYIRQWLASRPPKEPEPVFVRPDEPFDWRKSY